MKKEKDHQIFFNDDLNNQKIRKPNRRRLKTEKFPTHGRSIKTTILPTIIKKSETPQRKKK